MKGNVTTMAPQARGIEDITVEIVELKKTAGSAILDIGKGLAEAKGMLEHGEWLVWLETAVDFSPRTAQAFMQLAANYTNAQTLAHLGTSKALALLALPEAEREIFIGETHLVAGKEKAADEMSSREFKRAIMEKEQALADARIAEEARSKMESDLKFLTNRLTAANGEAEATAAKAQALETELAELRGRPVEVAVEQDTKAIEEARKSAIAEMKEMVDKAKAAQKAAEVSLVDAKAQLEELARAEKREALSANKDLAMFDLVFSQSQEQANRLHGLLLKSREKGESDTAEKMKTAMLALADAIRRAAE